MSTSPISSSALPDNVIYHERLTPSPGIWASAHVLVIGLFLIIVQLSPAVALITGLVSALALIVILWVMSPQIIVHGEFLRAGRAEIDVAYLGVATLLDKDLMAQERGPGLNALTYLCAPGWLHQGLKIENSDSDDPTPYWLLASRRPNELAEALQKAKGLTEESTQK